VSTTQIVDNTIGLADMGDNSVSSAEIVDNSVSSADIMDNTVSSADILDNTVASADIMDNTVASADILDNTIQSIDIQDGGVQTVDLSTVGAIAAGQALTYNGTSVVWDYPTAGNLKIPFSQSATNAATLFSLTQNGGAGDVANFVYNTPAGVGNAVEATSNGAGATIRSENSDGGAAIAAVNSGTGAGVTSSTGNGNAFAATVSGSGDGLNVAASGSGDGVDVTVSGTGRAGSFANTNGANTSNTVEISSNANDGVALSVAATGTSGDAIVATANGDATSNTLMASNTGAGRAGVFDNTQPTNASTIVRVQSAGSMAAGNAGVDVELSNTNASNLGDAVHGRTAGYGFSGRFEATTANGDGVYISTVDGGGQTGLQVNRGGVIMPFRSVNANYNVTLDDGIVRVQDNGVGGTTYTVTLPVAGIADGQIVWVYNGDVDALSIGIRNGDGTAGVYFISPWRGAQFTYISALGGWVPMSNL